MSLSFITMYKLITSMNKDLIRTIRNKKLDFIFFLLTRVRQ